MSAKPILFVDASPGIGGATRVLFDILDALDPRRATPLVVCRPRSAVASAMKDRGIATAEVDLPVLTFAGEIADQARMVAAAVNATRELVQQIRALRPALIHASGLASTLLAALPARLTAVPLVWHAHDMLPREARTVPVIRVAAAAARLVVCVSETSRDRLLQFGVAADKCRLVLGGVALAPERQVVDRAGRPPVLLAVGTITPQKGQHVLIAAAPELVRRYPDLQIAIAGVVMFDRDREYLRRMEQDVERAGLSRHVKFLGFSTDVASLLEHATALVHPATAEETLGLVPLEAMAAGLPVVASRIGGLKEVVEDGVSGFLVEPGDGADLVRAVAVLLDDPALRARMGAEGRRIAAERFGVERMRRELDQVFADVLGEGVLRRDDSR